MSELLPARKFDPDTTAYWKEKSFFWSAQQAAVSPKCFVQPTSAEDVARVVVLAQETQCKFAVKSGGHGAFVGASNIQDGITIDLSHLTQIEVSEDQTITKVGPGNRWLDVYEHLVPKDLMVIGGRDAEIGVGGLTLGGGISWFSGRHGWAADGVRNYELVTASGEILEVNLESYPDLYWALRGGGNNFGIVTRFDLETFPQTGMWGGSVVTSEAGFGEVLDAFYDFAHNAPQDVDTGTYSAIAWDKEHQMWISSSAIVYTRPVEFPAIFENYTKIERIHDTLALRDMISLSHETSSSSPNGLRETYWTATFWISKEMLQAILQIYMEEVEPLKQFEAIVPALIYQPITTDVLARFQRNGGNCMGLGAGEEPLLNINLSFMWKDEADDEAVIRAARSSINRMVEKSKELGVEHRYLYQNYASGEQDVMGGYGEENRAKLKEISKKYDPDQVFQVLQPGYFKL